MALSLSTRRFAVVITVAIIIIIIIIVIIGLFTSGDYYYRAVALDKLDGPLERDPTAADRDRR